MLKNVILFLSTIVLLPALAGAQPNGWMCGMMDWMPQGGISAENLPERDSAQAKTYAKFCGQCHALPNPVQNSKEDWNALVDRMDARMKMMAGDGGMMMHRHGMMHDQMHRMMDVKAMTMEERAAIIEYLQKHSMRTAKGLDKLETVAGFAEFKRVCSQCHALPDPSLHAKNEWTEVVNRMETHHQQKGLGGFAGKDKTTIVKFLGETLKK